MFGDLAAAASLHWHLKSIFSGKVGVKVKVVVKKNDFKILKPISVKRKQEIDTF